ncbi:MAG: TlpA family protein disulfide reductase [Acidobacteriota bacterium]|nr:TlpA family protein disulfide reductase [Acidobacteriota bacterium]
MPRLCALLLIFAATAVSAESPMDQLKRTAEYYRTIDSFDVKGTVTANIPETSWQGTYEYETEGAQPRYLPMDVHSSTLQTVTRVGAFKLQRVVNGATDPKPDIETGLPAFGEFDHLTDHLVSAQKVGTAVIPFEGKNHLCDVIDAEYDFSPDFKPHTQVEHHTIVIDPATLAVLRETRPDPKVGEWIATVTSFTVHQSPSAMLLDALQKISHQPNEKSKWIGREVPDITLKQLVGPSVDLAKLRGKPVLLDFWGSYCVPCKRATLMAQGFARRYQSSGLQVLTITQDSPQDAKGWTAFNHVTLPVLLDEDGSAFKAFDIEGVPDAILINSDGKVARYWVGFDDKAKMESDLDASLLSAQRGAHR